MDVAAYDEFQFSLSTITRKGRPQQEDVVEDTQTQGTNLKLNAIIVKSLATMPRNIDFFRNKVEEETNYVEEKDEKFEIMLLARRSNKGNKENSWYLYNGASNRMCGKKNMVCGA